jgi:hypothetical protein
MITRIDPETMKVLRVLFERMHARKAADLLRADTPELAWKRLLEAQCALALEAELQSLLDDERIHAHFPRQ